jgi:hypothetical protein
MSSRMMLLVMLAPLGAAYADDRVGPPEPAASAAAPTLATPAVPSPTLPTPAVPAPAPALTLPAGAFNVALTLELEASAGKLAMPIALAPDLGYGVTRDLTLALVHSKYALTGFRAAAGGSLCLASTDSGCPTIYNNVGAEAWYTLARGELAFAAVGGVHAVDLDRSLVVVKAGARARHAIGKLAVTTQPSVLIAVNQRTDAMGARLNKDLIYVPVLVTYRVAPPLVLGLATGLKGPISGFGDAWQVPLGVTAQYAITPKLGVGASWVFGQLIGGATNPPAPAPAVKGPDLRGVQAWATYTM